MLSIVGEYKSHWPMYLRTPSENRFFLLGAAIRSLFTSWKGRDNVVMFSVLVERLLTLRRELCDVL